MAGGRTARRRGVGVALVGAAACGVAPAVAAAAWSAPQDLVPMPTITEGHRALAVDARGTAIALLDHGDPLRYAEQPVTEPWAAPRSLGPAFGVGLLVTPTESLAVWTDRVGDASRVVAASRTLEGVWSAPTEIAQVPSRYLRVMNLSANTHRDAVVGLVETDEPSNRSVVLARTAGGPWSPLDLGAAPRWARVIVNDAGAMTAVWREDAPDQNPGRGRLRMAERALGGAFVEVPSPSGEEEVALSSFSGTPGGDALLVASADLPAQTVWLRPAGGSFGPPRVVRGRFWGADFSSLGADGTAVLAWRAAREIRALVRPPGGVFGSPVAIAAPPPDGAVTGPLVAVGGDGTAVVAWSSLRSTGPGRRVAGTVWASVRPPGGTFGRAVVLNDRSLPAALQRVAAGPRGAAVITWTASKGSGFVLQAARNEPRPLIARLKGTSRDGDASVRIRLAEPARVTVTLQLPAGRVLARRTRSLPGGASAVVIAGTGALAPGRYRVQVSARSADRSAAASAQLRVAGPRSAPQAGTG